MSSACVAPTVVTICAVGVDALADQPRGQHAAQAGVALRLAIAHGGVERCRRVDLAHGGGHEVGAQPMGGSTPMPGCGRAVGGVSCRASAWRR